ncbi:hypothetical protein HYY69_04610 [Candidatus Woesearchaeota archaeon]|nr:hypothetical protein [Candidatus Woesearchaeota archaeon]
MFDKKGKVLNSFVLRMIGGVLGAVGFLLLANRMTIVGTALIGIGSLFIAVGEN